MSKKADQIKNLMKKLDNTVEVSVVKDEKKLNPNNLNEILLFDEMKKLSDDKNIVELLINSSIEIFSIQVKNALILGKIFQNIFDKIGNQNTGLYEKWLTLNGFNKYTALRYRKRYELYELVSSEQKEIVAILPQKYIDIMYLEENRETYINLVKSGASSKEIIEMIESNIQVKTLESKEEKEIVSLDHYKFLSSKAFKKIETLEEKEKIKLQKYLDGIDKILNKK